MIDNVFSDNCFKRITEKSAPLVNQLYILDYNLFLLAYTF